jgi:carboxymethylenebutenolidase
MTMVFNHVIAQQDGREFKAHIEYPPNGAKGPGLILLHEVYGANDSLIEVAKQYAQQGFVVMCV